MNVSCEHIKCPERRKNYIQHEMLNVHHIRDSKITESALKGADHSNDITTLKKKKEWEKDASGPASLLIWVQVS